MAGASIQKKQYFVLFIFVYRTFIRIL